jgi:hypothetical protein
MYTTFLLHNLPIYIVSYSFIHLSKDIYIFAYCQIIQVFSLTSVFAKIFPFLNCFFVFSITHLHIFALYVTFVRGPPLFSPLYHHTIVYIYKLHKKNSELQTSRIRQDLVYIVYIVPTSPHLYTLYIFYMHIRQHNIKDMSNLCEFYNDIINMCFV